MRLLPELTPSNGAGPFSGCQDGPFPQETYAVVKWANNIQLLVWVLLKQLKRTLSKKKLTNWDLKNIYCWSRTEKFAACWSQPKAEKHLKLVSA